MLSLNKNEEIGHQFTDGGALDNFPVRFIDNKKVRQKYFSHPRILQSEKNHTIIYAFGINQIDPEQKDHSIEES